MQQTHLTPAMATHRNAPRRRGGWRWEAAVGFARGVPSFSLFRHIWPWQNVKCFPVWESRPEPSPPEHNSQPLLHINRVLGAVWPPLLITSNSFIYMTWKQFLFVGALTHIYRDVTPQIFSNVPILCHNLSKTTQLGKRPRI